MYIGIDTETGGFRAGYHSLLTVGLVVVDSLLRIRHRFEIKVQANKSRCTKAAFNVNKIDVARHNKTAISKAEAVKLIQHICDKYGGRRVKLIGHNVPFDIGFIKALFKSRRKKFRYSHSTTDTQGIWRGLIAMKKVNMTSAHLDDILDYLKIKTPGQRHSALTDIINTIKVLRVVRNNTNSF